MATIKLTRDQARLVSKNWMPYMIMFAESKLRSNSSKDVAFLNCKIMLSLLQEIDIMFQRKLLGSSNNLSFKLSDAQASIFYFYLMIHPIASIDVYAYNFRQQLCNALHKDLFFNRPPAPESTFTIQELIDMDYE